MKVCTVCMYIKYVCIYMYVCTVCMYVTCQRTFENYFACERATVIYDRLTIISVPAVQLYTPTYIHTYITKKYLLNYMYSQVSSAYYTQSAFVFVCLLYVCTYVSMCIYTVGTLTYECMYVCMYVGTERLNLTCIPVASR